MCLNMFVGMSGCLLPQLVSALLACVRAKAAPEDTTQPLLQDEAEQPAEDAPPAKQKLAGLRGLLVLGAPTVGVVERVCCSVSSHADAPRLRWRTWRRRRCPTSG
jgi:hypothetical protein